MEKFAGFDLKEWEGMGFAKCVRDGLPHKLVMTARNHMLSIEMSGDLYLNRATEWVGIEFKGATPFFVKQLIERLDED